MYTNDEMKIYTGKLNINIWGMKLWRDLLILNIFKDSGFIKIYKIPLVQFAN